MTPFHLKDALKINNEPGKNSVSAIMYRDYTTKVSLSEVVQNLIEETETFLTMEGMEPSLSKRKQHRVNAYAKGAYQGNVQVKEYHPEHQDPTHQRDFASNTIWDPTVTNGMALAFFNDFEPPTRGANLASEFAQYLRLKYMKP